MARQARIIIPGCAHFVVNRARPGVRLFRDDGDRARYRALLGENAATHAVTIGEILLEPDHVELFLTPQTCAGLARAIGATHRLFARHRDLGEGALWAGRFQSCPVASEFAACAKDIRPVLMAAARRGRPVGDPAFITIVGNQTGWDFTPKRRGRKPKC
jgi:REP element-mobilizing transposase RayT